MPLTRVDLLGDDQAQPGIAQRVAQPDQEGRQRARQHHGHTSSSRLRPKQVAASTRLGVDGADPGIEVEIDRKRAAQRHQHHFRRLVDAEPENDQRHQGQERDGAKHLDRRVDRHLADARQAPTAAPANRRSAPQTTGRSQHAAAKRAGCCRSRRWQPATRRSPPPAAAAPTDVRAASRTSKPAARRSKSRSVRAHARRTAAIRAYAARSWRAHALAAQRGAGVLVQPGAERRCRQAQQRDDGEGPQRSPPSRPCRRRAAPSDKASVDAAIEMPSVAASC